MINLGLQVPEVGRSSATVNNPAFFVYRSAGAITLTTAVSTAYTFDTVLFDNGHQVWNNTNPTRILIPFTGIYFLTSSVEFAPGAITGTVRETWFQANGSTVFAGTDHIPNATYNFSSKISCVTQLNAGDYFELFCFQDSGGNLNVNFGVLNGCVSGFRVG